jgi:hypothetical protein
VSTVDDPLPNSTAVDVDYQPPGEAVSDTPDEPDTGDDTPDDTPEGDADA